MPPTRSVHIARVTVFDDLAAAAPAWRQLEASPSVATPFGRFQWVSLWQRHVGARQGFTPLIAVGWDEQERPLFLLPFARRVKRALTTAQYFGGSHSPLNMGLWRQDVAQSMTRETLHVVLSEIVRSGNIDLFALRSQPLTWCNTPNPFALLAHQPSADDILRLDLGARNNDALLRLRTKPDGCGALKAKERKLQKLEGYRYFRATTPAEVRRLLEAFFVQKDARLRARGIKNVFADPAVADFIYAGCLEGLATGHPVIELHAIEGGGEVLAVLGGTAWNGRFSAMFNSYTLTAHARWSPGLILITHVVRQCVERGFSSFDLGAGYAPYKRLFCKKNDQLFDSFLAFSLRGHVAASALRTIYRLKRWAKTTTVLRKTINASRRLRILMNRRRASFHAACEGSSGTSHANT